MSFEGRIHWPLLLWFQLAALEAENRRLEQTVEQMMGTLEQYRVGVPQGAILHPQLSTCE